MNNIRVIPAIMLLLIGLGSWPDISSATEDRLRLGVFPYLSPTRMDEIFSPISRDLTINLDQAVTFRTTSTMPKFKENLQSATYDLVMVQPILYPLAVDRLGYIPLARIQEQIYSVIMVLPDSPLTSVTELAGKTIATPPVNGPVVMLARKHLARNGINPETDVTFDPNKTVSVCLQKVLIRQADACIAPSFAVPPFEKNMGVSLRRLYVSEGVPNRTFVVHPRVPDNVSQKIQQTILSWTASGPGEAILKSLNTEGFVAVKDSDFDIVRSLVSAR